MFHKIEIERFRGIRYALIDGFKQVNLFFGKNNCGKSSLLESLFFTCGLSNPILPIHANYMRGYTKARINDLQLEFYNMDTNHPIQFRMTDGEVRELCISLVEENVDNISLDARDNSFLSNMDAGMYGLDFKFKINQKTFSSQLMFDPVELSKAKRTVPDNYMETLRCTYLNPKFDFNASVQGLKNILFNKDESFIIEGLQMIEPRTKDFTFTDNDMLVDIGLPKRIPVNMMGDGARKIVALLTSIYNNKDGVVLVDEISNGFHYSVMKELWEILIRAAIRNNTQMFVTTHDIDSIKGLRDAAIGMDADHIATFKLLKTQDDELKAYHYSLDSLDYSINQEIEIR